MGSRADVPEKQGVETGPLRLDFRKVQKLEIITDDDRYHTTTLEMAAACRQSAEFRTWITEFEDFLVHLYEWSAARPQVVEYCYLSSGDEGLKAFLITRGKSYRFDFDDDVTDLEINLTRIYPRCPVEVIQMPSASRAALQSFFSPDKAYQVYGQPEAT